MQLIHSNDRRQTNSDTRRTSSSRGASSCLSTLEVGILLLCLVTVIAVFAHCPAQTSTDLLTTRVSVRATQTLWDLANEHPIDGLSTVETVERIKQINGLTDSQLIAGQELCVPAITSVSAAMASR